MDIFSDTSTERFLAYFDIMGFKDLIYRNDHSFVEKKMNQMSNIIETIEASESGITDVKEAKGYKLEFRHKSVVLPVVFSDSIIFISESNSDENAIRIIDISALFLKMMFRISLPVKGVLSYGTFCANFKNSTFFGLPLVDAHSLTEEVHFYGAVLHNTFDKYLYENNLNSAVDRIVCSKQIPMKSGSIHHSYLHLPSIIHDSESITLNDLIDNFYRSTCGEIRKYVDNTKSIYAISS
jgi:hypothetical protein